MKREDAIDRLRAHADEIRARGAVSLYLFGSTARGEARDDSDVDVFIDCDLTRRFSIHDRFGLQDFLSGILAADVDLGLRGELHPVLRDDIMRQAVKVF